MSKKLDDVNINKDIIKLNNFKKIFDKYESEWWKQFKIKDITIKTKKLSEKLNEYLKMNQPKKQNLPTTENNSLK